MLERPGSENACLWFFYKIRRKLHILRSHGTLFHRLPRKERFGNRKLLKLRRTRKRSRKIRHLFFYFRPVVLKRFNRILYPQIRKEVLKEKKSRNIYRRLRYLHHTGNLFKIDYRSVMDFMNRNYSFLGKGKFLVILLNSTFIFLLAYLFVFLVRELAIVVTAGSFDINVAMMYYDVEFLIRSRDWTEEAVKVVFSTGPVIGFLLAVIAVTVFAMAGDKASTVRIFIMWVFLHAFTQSFGEMILGALFNQGFGWVLAYLYFIDTEKMLLVLGLFICMLAGGMFVSRFLMLSGNVYFNYLDRSNRGPFLISQVLLPFIIGTAMIILVKQPLKNSFELFVESTMLIVLVPALIRSMYSNELFFDEEPRKIRIKWLWIFLTVLAFVLFRIFFWKGVRL